jgi:hypothetical protein
LSEAGWSNFRDSLCAKVADVVRGRATYKRAEIVNTLPRLYTPPSLLNAVSPQDAALSQRFFTVTQTPL